MKKAARCYQHQENIVAVQISARDTIYSRLRVRPLQKGRTTMLNCCAPTKERPHIQRGDVSNLPLNIRLRTRWTPNVAPNMSGHTKAGSRRLPACLARRRKGRRSVSLLQGKPRLASASNHEPPIMSWRISSPITPPDRLCSSIGWQSKRPLRLLTYFGHLGKGP